MTSRRLTASRGVFAVNRGQRAVVSGVHGLEHVERLLAADLADDDAVGPHTETVDQKLPLPYRAVAFQIRGAGFETRQGAAVSAAIRPRLRW